ncbi:MAG: cytidylyltransferase domain-containing protein [Candidatus Neomarinimicrobiota bacterium]
MKVVVIIQARMGSSRLPNKVLSIINGKPVLEYLIDQVMYKNKNIPIIIATSKDKTDIKIVNYCIKNNIRFYTGDLLNVASRFYEIIKMYNFDYFVRICADSPLLDGDLIKKAVSYANKNIDIITNVMPRSFPKGQSVEVVNCKTFLSHYHKLISKEDLEHVTRYFYNNLKNFNIFNFCNDKDLSSINLSIDTKKDYQNVSKIICNLRKNHFEYSFKDIIGKIN